MSEQPHEQARTPSPGFLWGVATAAYQVEGGINGPGQPANNWADWDRAGRVERCGDALRFWDDPHELLDRAQAIGCNAFRMSIAWERVQPSPGRDDPEPDWDAVALDRYADILTGCRKRGMEPIVTLLHFTHPLWCGLDFWLRSDSPERFGAYARRCVGELGRRLADRGQPAVRWWITLNEPAVVPLMTYVLGMFPGGRRTPNPLLARRAFDNAYAAHVLAYDAVHDVYETEGWGEPLVSTNTIGWTLVDLDAVPTDLLLARERGVDRASLAGHLRRCRTRARRRVAAAPRRNAVAALADAVAHRAAKVVGLPSDGAAASALFSSPRARKLDYLSLDVYDPVIGNFAGAFPPAAVRRARGRWFVPELWEQSHRRDALTVFLRQAHLQAPDRPILLAENGMATPGARPRFDGLRRDDMLRDMCAETVRVRDEGIPVAGYVHWTIADNYEWGSYAPRFGLHGVDRTRAVRILDTDATGVDAAAAYREIIAADRS